jgi:hypothetical protein
MDEFEDEVQKMMADRYDTEFAQVMGVIQKAHNKGYLEGIQVGKERAKAEIINLIQGEKE